MSCNGVLLPRVKRLPREPGPLAYRWSIQLGRRRLYVVTIQPFRNEP